MTKLGEPLEVWEVEPARVPIPEPMEVEEGGDDLPEHEPVTAPQETPEEEAVPV